MLWILEQSDTCIVVSPVHCVCTSAAALFHQLLLGLFKLLQLCDRYGLVLVLSWQLLSAAKRFVCFFFIFFCLFSMPSPQMGFWLNRFEENPMISCIYTWTNEVMTVHTGWLQSQFSLRNLSFVAVMASPLSALPDLNYLWHYKTISSLQPLVCVLGFCVGVFWLGWFFVPGAICVLVFFCSKMMNILCFCLVS